MKNKHLLIITGFSDTEDKENLLHDLLEKVSNIDNVDVCYCTHHKNISNKVYSLCNYVVYNDYNPILNWDIRDSKTIEFRNQYVVDDHTLLFPICYHGYAHLLSLCDGISLGVNAEYEYFSFMNYDVKDFCVHQLPGHVERIKNNLDFIGYPWANKSFNTEFFTFNKHFATKIHPLRKYQNYISFKEIVFESIMKEFIDNNNFNVLLLEHNDSEDILGQSFFDNYLGGRHWSPYYGEGKDQIVMLPYTLDNENIFFTVEYQKENDFKIILNDVDIMDEPFDDMDNEIYRLKTPVKMSLNSTLKFYINNTLIRDFVFDDYRHIGFTK